MRKAVWCLGHSTAFGFHSYDSESQRGSGLPGALSLPSLQPVAGFVFLKDLSDHLCPVIKQILCSCQSAAFPASILPPKEHILAHVYDVSLFEPNWAAHRLPNTLPTSQPLFKLHSAQLTCPRQDPHPESEPNPNAAKPPLVPADRCRALLEAHGSLRLFLYLLWVSLPDRPVFSP